MVDSVAADEPSSGNPGSGRRLDRSDPATFPEWFNTRKPRANLIVARWVPLALVGLPVLVLFCIVVYPTVWMFYHALHDTNMMRLFQSNWSWVGFENFATVLSSPRFGDSIVHLGIYLTFGAVLQVLLGAALALILYELVKNNFLRVVLLIAMVLPMMLPPSIVGVLWKFLLTPSNGAINQALLNLGLIDQHIEWFNAGMSLWSIIITDEMIDRLLADMPLTSGDRISLMVNSLGATPPEELYIMYRRAKARLEAAGVTIVMPLVGRYGTSMEMTGATVTWCRLDDELETLLKAPADCAFWRV